MVNKVILVGNLGGDPEVRHLESGAVVARLNIATNETYKNKNGERVKQTEWHNVELWEGLAKVAEQYLKQGDTVYVEGKIRTETWTDSEGNTRKTVKIRGNSMTMLGGKGQNNGGMGAGNANGSSTASSANSSAPASPEPAKVSDDFSDDIDDLPF